VTPDIIANGTSVVRDTFIIEYPTIFIVNAEQQGIHLLHGRVSGLRSRRYRSVQLPQDSERQWSWRQDAFAREREDGEERLISIYYIKHQ